MLMTASSSETKIGKRQKNQPQRKSVHLKFCTPSSQHCFLHQIIVDRLDPSPTPQLHFPPALSNPLRHKRKRIAYSTIPMPQSFPHRQPTPETHFSFSTKLNFSHPPPDGPLSKFTIAHTLPYQSKNHKSCALSLSLSFFLSYSISFPFSRTLEIRLI